MSGAMAIIPWTLAGIGTVVSILTLTGTFVPRRLYDDLREERDGYREAAQSCAHTVTVVEEQLVALRKRFGLDDLAEQVEEK